MKRSTVQRSIRLDPRQFELLVQTAARQRRSLADVLRTAVEQYLSGTSRAADSDLRHHRISEFSQVALDTIIREQHPEMIEAIVSETNRRMERYHGAR
ncbi:hypothetical protein [uncultured Sphingomonas sp.]|uniref:hypothetical protein n=1 Tax=uncultured Sphingomonas sp. TaxID=158754 RepID=UPI0035CA0619